MDYKDAKHIYFLGIGGIGMSALARYMKRQGKYVSGYDRTPSPLTQELEKEGINIVYDGYDHPNIDNLSTDNTLVVRTPAVREEEEIYTLLRQKGFEIIKRSEMLGLLTQQRRALCVAGTHGKTTTSTLLAHILHQSHVGANAFLGGISENYHTNLLTDDKSNFVVVEADEYDRSFHHLTPYMSVITSIEPDHLDIYGNAEGYQEGFDIYAGLVENIIVLKQGFELHGTHCTTYTYTGLYHGSEQPNFWADNVRVADGKIHFDFHADIPTGHCLIRDVQPGVPAWVNIENSVAAMALAWLNGATEEEIRQGVQTFKGVYRRFNVHVNNERVAYIDDYAHHPSELKASIESVRHIYPERKLIGIFQPHLYTRTRDFKDEFREVLQTLDELILLPIYPAREQPICGITSEVLISRSSDVVVPKSDLCHYLKQRIDACDRSAVVMTLGAGDIDRLVESIQRSLENRV